jgi:hypothetical protein
MNSLSHSKEDRLLLACACTGARTHDINEFLEEKLLNWDYILESSMRHDIQPLLYWNLDKIDTRKNVPVEIMAILKKVYYRNVLRNMSIYDQLGIVLNAFKDAGIDVIVLKGAFLAEIVYGNIGLRSLNDVDLLIEKEDLHKVNKELAQLRYDVPVYPTKLHEKLVDQLAFDKEIHYINHVKNILIDIHWDITPSDSFFQIDIRKFWENAQSVKIAGVQTLMLAPEDLLQHLCLHLNKHIDDNSSVPPFQFKGFCDIAEVIRHYDKNINWNYLVQNSKNYRIEKQMYQGLYIVNKFFGAFVPIDVLRDLKTINCNSYFEDVFRNLNTIESDLKKKNQNKQRKEFNYLERLSKIDGIWNKVKILFGDVFPCKEFMIQHYQIKNKKLICVYYVIRFGIALRWGINVLSRSLLYQFRLKSKKAYFI